MKQKIVALLLISVMTVSVFGAVGLTTATKAQAATATKMDAYQSPTYPYRGQTYTVSLYLRTSGGAVKGAAIEVWWKYTWDTNYRYQQTRYTDPYGHTFFTEKLTTVHVIQYKFVYRGSSAYSPITKYLKIYSGVASAGIAVTNSNPVPSQSFYVVGRVTDLGGKRLENIPCILYYRYWKGPGAWSGWTNLWGTKYTNYNGEIWIRDSDWRLIQYKVQSLGTSKYWSSTSGIIQVDAR